MVNLDQFIPKYMIPGYSPETHGTGDIREEDVCRASNHRWSQHILDGDSIHWRSKSASICPTYGNCGRCYCSGPLGYNCTECAQQRAPDTCLVIFYAGLHHYIVDSEALAHVLNKKHEVAQANQKYMWLWEPSMILDPEIVSIAIRRDHPNEEDRERERELNMAVQKFCAEML